MASAFLLSSCSRQAAYFQPSSVYHATQTEPAQVNTSVNEAPAPNARLVPANVTLARLDAYGRNDSKLAANERLSSHLNRANKLLAPSHQTGKPIGTQATGKKTLMERLVLRKINRQLAPNQPEKALLANRGQLIGGLILLIAGTGTAAFIGLILALIGALGVILGFFGQ